MHGSIVAILGVETKEFQTGFACAYTRVEEHGGHMEFALKLALNDTDTHVWVQSL
ncbi:hypothetical protein D3C85_1918890 [compost metagenome]